MKKAKFIGPVYLFAYIIPIVLAMSIVCLIFKEYVGAGCLFALFVLIVAFIIGYRKILFRKLLIDDEGLTLFYNKKIVKKLKWEEITFAQISQPTRWVCITFSDRPLYSGKESWKNNEMAITFTTNFSSFKTLFSYKERIPVEIEGLGKMPEYYIKNLKK